MSAAAAPPDSPEGSDANADASDEANQAPRRRITFSEKVQILTEQQQQEQQEQILSDAHNDNDDEDEQDELKMRLTRSLSPLASRPPADELPSLRQASDVTISISCSQSSSSQSAAVDIAEAPASPTRLSTSPQLQQWKKPSLTQSPRQSLLLDKARARAETKTGGDDSGDEETRTSKQRQRRSLSPRSRVARLPNRLTPSVQLTSGGGEPTTLTTTTTDSGETEAATKKTLKEQKREQMKLLAEQTKTQLRDFKEQQKTAQERLKELQVPKKLRKEHNRLQKEQQKQIRSQLKEKLRAEREETERVRELEKRREKEQRDKIKEETRLDEKSLKVLGRIQTKVAEQRDIDEKSLFVPIPKIGRDTQWQDIDDAQQSFLQRQARLEASHEVLRQIAKRLSKQMELRRALITEGHLITDLFSQLSLSLEHNEETARLAEAQTQIALLYQHVDLAQHELAKTFDQQFVAQSTALIRQHVEELKAAKRNFHSSAALYADADRKVTQISLSSRPTLDKVSEAESDRCYRLACLQNEARQAELLVQQLHAGVEIHVADSLSAVLANVADRFASVNRAIERTPGLVAESNAFAARQRLACTALQQRLAQLQASFDQLTELRWALHKQQLDRDGRTALHLAVLSGNKENVTFCLRADSADMERRDNEQRTPLHLACLAGHLPVVELLLQASCQPNVQDVHGNTPLHLLLLHGRSGASVDAELFASIMSYMLDTDPRFSPLDMANSDGNTPLHIACDGGFAQALDTLLKYRPSVHVRNAARCSPLQLGAARGNCRFVWQCFQLGYGLDSLLSDVGERQSSLSLSAASSSSSSSSSSEADSGLDYPADVRRLVAVLQGVPSSWGVPVIGDEVKAQLLDEFGIETDDSVDLRPRGKRLQISSSILDVLRQKNQAAKKTFMRDKAVFRAVLKQKRAKGGKTKRLKARLTIDGGTLLVQTYKSSRLIIDDSEAPADVDDDAAAAADDDSNHDAPRASSEPAIDEYLQRGKRPSSSLATTAGSASSTAVAGRLAEKSKELSAMQFEAEAVVSVSKSLEHADKCTLLLRVPESRAPVEHVLRFKGGAKERQSFCEWIAMLRYGIDRTADTERLRMFLATWNMGDAPPPNNLDAWIPSPLAVDLVAVTVQEAEYPARSPYTTAEADWFGCLQQHLGAKFVKLASGSLSAIRLIVFIRRGLYHKVSRLQVDTEATGIGNVIGNKGGVVISFDYNESSFALVGAHLAAHQKEVAARNSNYRAIVGRASRTLAGLRFDLLGAFDFVFWMGDLNYRLDLERQAAIELIEAADYLTLCRDHDQLTAQIACQAAFHGFHEAALLFPPTYKYNRGERVYETELMRIPSWCDRILWRTPADAGVTNVAYGCADSITTSDHSPVFAIFSCTTRLHPLPACTVDSQPPGSEPLYRRRQFDGTPSVIVQLAAVKLQLRAPHRFKAALLFVSDYMDNPLQVQKKKELLEWDEVTLFTFASQASCLHASSLRVFYRAGKANKAGTACGVIPLAAANPTAPFAVDLTSAGVPIGTLTGQVTVYESLYPI